MRDMIGALVVLLVLIGVLVFVTRSCSFSPGGPEVDPSSAPSVDVSEKLRSAASSAGFPLRQPDLPSDWRANSSSTAAVGTGAAANVVVRVGWITQAGRFVQLGQSAGTEPDVVAMETGRTGGVDPMPGEVVVVDGVRWTTYPSRREETAWATRMADVTVVISGSGNEGEFRTAAAAVQAAPPLTP